MGSVKDFVTKKPDQLLMLTFLTQLRENLNNPVRAGADKENINQIMKQTKSTKSPKKSPKKSLEEKLSKLTESLKRRSGRFFAIWPFMTSLLVHKAPKADICPFCNEQVFVAERYGSGNGGFYDFRIEFLISRI